jgi:hypothetical protein
MSKQLIDNINDYQAANGEILEFHYKLLPFFKNFQTDQIKKSLSSHQNLTIKEVIEKENELIITGIVKNNPVPLLLIVAGIGTLIGGALLYFNLDKVYRIIETPAGKALSGGFLVIVILILILVIKKLNK